MKHDWPPFEILPVDRFYVDHTYQRGLTPLAEEIGEDFEPFLFQTVTGNVRDPKKRAKKGSIAIIDGQNRWEGAKLAGVEAIPCVVFEGLAPSKEAEVFARIQMARKNMSSYERFRAQTVAVEKWPERAAIAGAVIAEGFDMGTASTAKSSNRTISAAAALEAVYRWGSGANHRTLAGGDVDMGIAFLREVLRVIREGFPRRERGYLSRDIIMGVGNFMTYVDGNGNSTVDLKKLVKRLQATNPDKLKTQANEIRRSSTVGGTSYSNMTKAILRQYSK